MKKFILILLCLISIELIHAQKIVLATYQYADNNRIRNIQPLADLISKRTGWIVETKSYPTVHQFIEGLQKNEVDIALINTFGYLLLDASSIRHRMNPYAVMKVKEGSQDNYKTSFVASADLNINKLADLAPIAKEVNLFLVAPGSTSGNLVPRLALGSLGIKDPETQFKSFAYGKTHKGTIEQVAAGTMSAGAFGSSEYHNFSSKEKIKLIWESPEIPLGPLMIHDRINHDKRKIILDILLELKENDPVLEAVKNGWTEARQAEKYILINSGYYLPFKNQLGDEKIMASILQKFAN
jgi:phosphate/phosphite/phosphonate ABC transporter binding protein